MTINLAPYSIEELVQLNKQVVTRIRFLQKQKQLEASLKFKICDIVSFLDGQNKKQEAMITHVGPKSISVITLKNQEPWKVSPSELTFKRKGDKADLFKFLDAGPKARMR